MADKLMPRLLTVAIGLLVLQRVVYHASYLANDPFALATFSDGLLYERAAADIVAHPPWGERPFYLQGIYAYLLAIPMAWREGPSGGLLLQLGLVAIALFVFHRACRAMFGGRAGALCTVSLLVYPGLAFYENKYLTAGLAEVSLCGMLGALVWVTRDARPRAAVAFGVASGLAVLVRGNMLLGLPCWLWAMVVLGRRHGRPRLTVGAFAAGVLLALAPMAIRNAVVTGSPTIFPAHGGGTSFYIGNNAHAKGLWNNAGGMLTGDVGREREELVAALEIGPGTPSEQASAIGRALYRRGAIEIAADPPPRRPREAKQGGGVAGHQERWQDKHVLGASG
ncbi:MAG: hypothetical protein AAF721_11490, partial [Myxococcota bacterium]